MFGTSESDCTFSEIYIKAEEVICDLDSECLGHFRHAYVDSAQATSIPEQVESHRRARVS